MKVIFLLIAILLIGWILKTLRQNRIADAEPRIRNMIPCDYCGLHVPEDEALKHEGRYYCCKEHVQRKQS